MQKMASDLHHWGCAGRVTSLCGEEVIETRGGPRWSHLQGAPIWTRDEHGLDELYLVRTGIENKRRLLCFQESYQNLQFLL